MTKHLPKCDKGEACERDRIHAPERITPEQLTELSLCPAHIAEIGEAQASKQHRQPPPAKR